MKKNVWLPNSQEYTLYAKLREDKRTYIEYLLDERAKMQCRSSRDQR